MLLDVFLFFFFIFLNKKVESFVCSILKVASTNIINNTSSLAFYSKKFDFNRESLFTRVHTNPLVFSGNSSITLNSFTKNYYKANAGDNKKYTKKPVGSIEMQRLKKIGKAFFRKLSKSYKKPVFTKKNVRPFISNFFKKKKWFLTKFKFSASTTSLFFCRVF